MLQSIGKKNKYILLIITFLLLTTINNTNEMAVNEFNARETNDMTIRDYNNEMLTYRDVANRIWTTSESNENRAIQLAAAELASAGKGSSSDGIASSLIEVAGSLGAAWLGSACHVAQEVYGTETNDWIKFRWWMYHQSPKWFKKGYMKYSLPISKFIKKKPTLKKMIKLFMDKQIKKVTWNV